MKQIATAAALLLIAIPTFAETTQPMPASRYEVWMGVTNWPSLADLQPVAAGSFDSIGLGLGAAMHVPLRQFENGDLLVGVDGFIVGTTSNISGLIDELLARHLYLGASLKWAFGDARNLQLDAGFGYHLADLAQVSSEYWGVEHEAWEEAKLGAFVGATRDIGAGHGGRQSGLTLALKVHFVDFGTVSDEDIFLEPILGPNAGSLEGPIYLLQVGFSYR